MNRLTSMPASSSRSTDRFTRSLLPIDVEAPFGGDFLASFGNERRLVRMDVDGNLGDARSAAISRLSFTCTVSFKQPQIAVLDVPAIFAQVQRDPVRPGQFGKGGRPDRVRLDRASGLADRGDVIDVDAQARHFVFSWRNSRATAGRADSL